MITIAGTALLHHDDTPDTPGEHWYHDHAEELLQDVTYLIYDTDPQANPLARVVAYADGVPAVDGVFLGLSANTTYCWITAISEPRVPTFTREESEPIMLTLQRSREVVMAEIPVETRGALGILENGGNNISQRSFWQQSVRRRQSNRHDSGGEW